jgi:hypothetical protein
MPKKKGGEHAAGTHNITQFFGAASPSQAAASNTPTRVPAAQLVAQPAQRNLKLDRIEARIGASRGAAPARARVRAANSDSEGEELRDSGTCVVLALCYAYPQRTLTICLQQEKNRKKKRTKQPQQTTNS